MAVERAVVVLKVYEVASLAVLAVALFVEGKTFLCFVALGLLHIDAQLMRAVSKLAPLPVRTHALFDVILAQRCFNFGGRD